jgi:hypothetical protein
MPSKPNARCLVLIPLYGPLAPKCDEALRELEHRGYPVRRVRGFSAIDQGRNQMASDALHEGFAETMWIDPDIGFEPDAVERLRGHGLPLVAGIYPQPGGRSLACRVLPGTGELVFGKGGGLVEIQHAAAGFLHVRREVYENIRDRLVLPLCNTRFGRGVWPFFLPHAMEEAEPAAGAPHHRYLTEDYAFSHRARQAGFKVMADTSIRLWRVGNYGYGWEDAGSDPERFESFRFGVT